MRIVRGWDHRHRSGAAGVQVAHLERKVLQLVRSKPVVIVKYMVMGRSRSPLQTRMTLQVYKLKTRTTGPQEELVGKAMVKGREGEREKAAWTTLKCVV